MNRDMNSIFMKLYVTWPEIWIFEVIFVVFKLLKNIIFNKIIIFVGRNTSNHACQIFCSKSNCETVHHWFLTVAKIMKNLKVCSAHSYLYPCSRFKVWVHRNKFEFTIIVYNVRAVSTFEKEHAATLVI